MRFVQRRMGVVLLRRIAGLIRLTTNVRVTNQVVQIASRGDFYTFICRLLRLLRFQRKRPFLSNDHRHTSRNSNQGNGHRVINVNEFQRGSLVSQVRTARGDGRRHFQASNDSSSVVNERISIVFLVVARRFLTVTTMSLTKAVFRGNAIGVAGHVGNHSQDERIKLASVRIVRVGSSLFYDVNRQYRFTG